MIARLRAYVEWIQELSRGNPRSLERPLAKQEDRHSKEARQRNDPKLTPTQAMAGSERGVSILFSDEFKVLAM